MENPVKCMKILAFSRKKGLNDAKSWTRDTRWQNLSRWYYQKYPKMSHNIFGQSAQSAKTFMIFLKKLALGVRSPWLTWLLTSLPILQLWKKWVTLFSLLNVPHPKGSFEVEMIQGRYVSILDLQTNVWCNENQSKHSSNTILCLYFDNYCIRR